MLGQPISMLIPEVVGFRLTGELPEGTTATDLVLTVTQMLRQRRVVSKFVEFYGPGLANLPLADRATIGNMSPEYGATCGIFPVDAETLRYLQFTGRAAEQVELVEAYCRAQGLFHEPGAPEPLFSDTLELDLATVEPSLAGPRRPQDRVALSDAASDFREELRTFVSGEAYQGWDMSAALTFPASDPRRARPKACRRSRCPRTAATASRSPADADGEGLDHGAVVIAAITSCTNTSNPSVMLGAGLLARKAVEAGLTRRPWVKTSLAPGSKVVTDTWSGRGSRAARAARVLARRLRLHDVHRQLRPAAGGDLARDRRARPHRLLGAVGQPQLRGAHPSRGQDELPRQPAAVRCVRAGGPDGHRHHARTAARRRAARRHLAVPARGRRRDRAAGRVGHVPPQLRRGVRRRRELERHRGSGRATATPGIRTRPTSSTRPTSTA